MRPSHGEMTENQLVFIGGLHRSGTSLLHEILRSHPAISGFCDTGVPEDEGQHLQDVYPTAEVFGGPGRFGFDSDSFMDETHPLATPENAALLLDQWRPLWDMSKPVLVEKSPPNLVRTRFLQRLFPGSRFIILLRHPIAVAYATLKWRRCGIVDLIEHNLRCYERFLADMPRLKHVLVLRYEEFVQDPGFYIGRICDWLGLEKFPVSREVHADINAKYLAQWYRDCRGFKGFGVKVACRMHRFEKRAAILGYSIHNPPVVSPGAWPGRDADPLR